MWGEVDSTFSSEEVHLFRSSREHPLDFLWQDRHDCNWLQPLFLNGNEKQEFPPFPLAYGVVASPSPEPHVEEEETMLMTWKEILLLLTNWGPLVHYSTWLQLLELAMNDAATAREMLAMRLPERNILKDLRQILLRRTRTCRAYTLKHPNSVIIRCVTIRYNYIVVDVLPHANRA